MRSIKHDLIDRVVWKRDKTNERRMVHLFDQAFPGVSMCWNIRVKDDERWVKDSDGAANCQKCVARLERIKRAWTIGK